jgi:hypothetical protein
LVSFFFPLVLRLLCLVLRVELRFLSPYSLIVLVSLILLLSQESRVDSHLLTRHELRLLHVLLHLELLLEHQVLLLLLLIQHVHSSLHARCRGNALREVSKLVELIEVLSSLE